MEEVPAHDGQSPQPVISGSVLSIFQNGRNDLLDARVEPISRDIMRALCAHEESIETVFGEGSIGRIWEFSNSALSSHVRLNDRLRWPLTIARVALYLFGWSVLIYGITQLFSYPLLVAVLAMEGHDIATTTRRRLSPSEINDLAAQVEGVGSNRLARPVLLGIRWSILAGVSAACFYFTRGSSGGIVHIGNEVFTGLILIFGVRLGLLPFALAVYTATSAAVATKHFSSGYSPDYFIFQIGAGLICRCDNLGTNLVARRYFSKNLETMALGFETTIPRVLRIPQDVETPSYLRMLSIAQYIRSLKVWIAFPQQGTPQALSKELALILGAVATQMYHYLPVESVAPAQDKKIPWYTALLRVFGAMLAAITPLLSLAVIRTLGISIDGKITLAWAVAGSIWVVVYAINFFDPRHSEKINTLKELIGVMDRK